MGNKKPRANDRSFFPSCRRRLRHRRYFSTGRNKIYPSDTGKTLKERTVLTARGVVCELLKDLSEDIIIPLTQNEDKSTYYSHPCGLELDFSKSAEENHALIRAIHPWGEAYFYHDIACLAALPQGSEVLENNTKYTDKKTITNVNIHNKTIDVLCGDGKILRIRCEHYKKYDRPLQEII